MEDFDHPDEDEDARTFSVRRLHNTETITLTNN
jgi:hypothetical protein